MIAGGERREVSWSGRSPEESCFIGTRRGSNRCGDALRIYRSWSFLLVPCMAITAASPLYRQRSFCSPFESAQPWADWLVSRIGPRSRVETPQIIPPVRQHPRRGWDSPRKPITPDTLVGKLRFSTHTHVHTLVSRIKSDASHATPLSLSLSLPTRFISPSNLVNAAPLFFSPSERRNFPLSIFAGKRVPRVAF